MDNQNKDIEKDVVQEEPKIPEDTAQFFAEAVDKMDKEIFFTAGVAKNKTTSIIKKRLEVEMVDVYEKINTAIAAGKYKLIDIKLTQDQANFLRRKNFNCTYLRTNGDYSEYNIFWS